MGDVAVANCLGQGAANEAANGSEMQLLGLSGECL